MKIRLAVNLSDAIRHHLDMYALAASAAGVSALALAQPAEAKIVYTPAHIVLRAQSSTQYYLDLNHDGVKDFRFAHGYFYSVTTGFFGSWVSMTPYKGNGNGVMGLNRNASALPAGVKIGPAGHFSRYGLMAEAGGIASNRTQTPDTSFSGAWANDGKGLRNRYVGLEFAIKGKVHYGWARVSVSAFHFTATLTGYAYETIRNKPIIAGKTHGKDVITLEPATLGHLARGASAIPAWRGAD
jgi:hypothetical protein